MILKKRGWGKRSRRAGLQKGGRDRLSIGVSRDIGKVLDRVRFLCRYKQY